MNDQQTFTGIDESGLQWLVTVYNGVVAEVATRRDICDTWSRPVYCKATPLREVAPVGSAS